MKVLPKSRYSVMTAAIKDGPTSLRIEAMGRCHRCEQSPMLLVRHLPIPLDIYNDKRAMRAFIVKWRRLARREFLRRSPRHVCDECSKLSSPA